MERSIRVTGRGSLKVRPDVTRLILTLEGTEKDHDAALRRSSEQTEALKDTLGKHGFARQDVRTLTFSVDAEYESYKDRSGAWRQRFEGYKFFHRVKAEFPVDSARLGRLLYALGRCSAKPQIRIEYAVSDPEAAKDRLIAKAAADSRAKAEILTAAAGVTLGEVLHIDYAWEELELVARPIERAMSVCNADLIGKESCDLDIEADDITVEDTVTVTWAIR